MESRYPFFETAVVAVDILDVKYWVAFVKMLARSNDFTGNFVGVDEAPKGATSIYTKDIVFADFAAENLLDSCSALITEHTINDSSGPVSCHQNRYLLTRQTTRLGFTSTLA